MSGGGEGRGGEGRGEAREEGGGESVLEHSSLGRLKSRHALPSDDTLMRWSGLVPQIALGLSKIPCRISENSRVLFTLLHSCRPCPVHNRAPASDHTTIYGVGGGGGGRIDHLLTWQAFVRLAHVQGGVALAVDLAHLPTPTRVGIAGVGDCRKKSKHGESGEVTKFSATASHTCGQRETIWWASYLRPDRKR